MAKGWIAGLLTGVVVAGIGLATASLVMGPVAPLRPATPPMLADEAGLALDVQADAPEAQPEAAEPIAAPDITTAPTGESPEAASEPVAPESEALAVSESEGTQALEPEPVAEDLTQAESQPIPVPAPEPEGLAEPEAFVADDAPTGDNESPATGEPAAVAAPEDTVSDVEAPAAQPLPETTAPAGDAAQAPAAPAPRVSDEPAIELAAADAARGVVPAPVAPVADEPEAAEARAAPVEPAETEPPAAPDPEPSTLPRIVVEAAPVPTPVPDVVMVSPEADLPPEVEADPAAAIVTDRLPRIGADPAEVPAAGPREPALSRNALAFAPSGDQPRLAFLLIDTGPDDRAALGDLGNLPFPVTVAVDASATDAEQALEVYRDRGAEVMLIVPLPEAATPTDVDITIEAYAPLLDRAVAVLAEESLGFQTLGPGAEQLATNLAESGHGLVTFPAGLNTGHKAALKVGVKAGLVFRDLDGEGQDGAVIRRFLDNAAFKARGEAGVIVVARARAETLQALLEWSLGTRAQSVALAPVSAVLAGK